MTKSVFHLKNECSDLYLPVGFQTSCFVGRIFEDYIAFLILVIAERKEDDVALVDPDLLAQFTTDVGEPLGAIETEGLESAIAEHFENLGIFLLDVSKIT